MSADLWLRGCERLAAELPEQQYNTWIRPLPCAEVSDRDDGGGAVVTVRVPNRFKLDWIRNQYGGRIEAVLSELAGKPVRLEVTMAVREIPVAVVPLPSPIAVTVSVPTVAPAVPAAVEESAQAVGCVSVTV